MSKAIEGNFPALQLEKYVIVFRFGGRHRQTHASNLQDVCLATFVPASFVDMCCTHAGLSSEDTMPCSRC